MAGQDVAIVQVGVDQPIAGAGAQLVGQAAGGRKPALGHRAAEALLSPLKRGCDGIGDRSQWANPVRRGDRQASQQSARDLGGGPEFQAVQGPGC
jgi:hypothetical protein